MTYIESRAAICDLSELKKFASIDNDFGDFICKKVSLS